MNKPQGLAVITGASSGIGLELAKQCAAHGFDLFLIADEDSIHDVASDLHSDRIEASGLRADLRREEGVKAAFEALQAAKRPIEALILNAGIGTAGSFAGETSLRDELEIIALNCTSVVHLAKLVVPGMVERGAGKVLVTSSIVADIPASLMAVYGATKAFDLQFAEALRDELKGTGVTVSAFQPGPTDTEFFRRGSMEERRVAQKPKDDPKQVAEQGFEAMMAGKDRIYAGSLKNRLLGAASHVMPEPVKARLHRRLAQRSNGETATR